MALSVLEFWAIYLAGGGKYSLPGAYMVNPVLPRLLNTLRTFTPILIRLFLL